MPQGPFRGKQPLGVIYNTSMNRPDTALALAALNVLEGKRESRIGSVCVVGAGLNTAIFCDIVTQVYQFGAPRNGNSALPVGLAAVEPLPPDPPMVKLAVERKNDQGEPQYKRTIRKLTDTSLAEAVLRNGVIFNAEAAVVLSAPATYLAKSLDLLGTPDIYKQRVKRLVVVDSGEPQQDKVALRKVLAEWPTPVFYCGPEVGEALRFPGASLAEDFAWAPAHPVVDAYSAYKPMPYDAPLYDLAAVHYAVHPDSGFFQVSQEGAVTVGDDGRMRFSAGGGKVRSLIVDPAQKEMALQALVEIASAKPAPPQQRIRPAGAVGQDAKAADAKPPDGKPAVVKKQ
jgi:purine nucleosidase